MPQSLSVEISEGFDLLESVFSFAVDEPKHAWFRHPARTYDENLRLYRRLFHISKPYEEQAIADALQDEMRDPVYIIGRRSSGKTSLCSTVLYKLREYFGPLIFRVDLKFPDPQYSAFCRRHPEHRGRFEYEWLRHKVEEAVHHLIDSNLRRSAMDRYDLVVSACLDANEDAASDSAVTDGRHRLKRVYERQAHRPAFDSWLIDAKASGHETVLDILAEVDSALSLEGWLRALCYHLQTKAGMALIFFDNIEGLQSIVEAGGRLQFFRELAWSFGEFGKVLFALRPSTASPADLTSDLRIPTSGALKKQVIIIDGFHNIPATIRDLLADSPKEDVEHCTQILQRRLRLAYGIARSRFAPAHSRVSEDAWAVIRRSLRRATEARRFLDHAGALANDDLRQVCFHGVRIARMMHEMQVGHSDAIEDASARLEAITIDSFLYFYCATSPFIHIPHVYRAELFCPAQWAKDRASKVLPLVAFEPYLILARAYRLSTEGDGKGNQGTVSVGSLIEDLTQCGLSPERVRGHLAHLCSSPDYEHGFLETERQYFGIQPSGLEELDRLTLRPRARLILEDVGRKYQFLLGSLRRINWVVGGSEFWPDASKFFSLSCIEQVLRLICALAELEVEVDRELKSRQVRYLQRFGLYRSEENSRPFYFAHFLLDQSFGFLRDLAESNLVAKEAVVGFDVARGNYNAHVGNTTPTTQGWMIKEIPWQVYK